MSFESSHKKTLNTFNDKVAEFFLEKGVKVLVLYEADDVRCYKVTLRGREQLRLLESEDYIPLAAASMLDPQRVIISRTRPPLFTLVKDGQPIVVAEKDGMDVLAFCRDGEFLKRIVTPPGGTFPDGLEVRSVGTWEELHAILVAAKQDGIKGVRMFIGFGYHQGLPFQETYAIELPLSVTTAATARQDSAQTPEAVETPPTVSVGAVDSKADEPPAPSP